MRISTSGTQPSFGFNLMAFNLRRDSLRLSVTHCPALSGKPIGHNKTVLLPDQEKINTDSMLRCLSGALSKPR